MLRRPHRIPRLAAPLLTSLTMGACADDGSSGGSFASVSGNSSRSAPRRSSGSKKHAPPFSHWHSYSVAKISASAHSARVCSTSIGKPACIATQRPVHGTSPLV